MPARSRKRGGRGARARSARGTPLAPAPSLDLEELASLHVLRRVDLEHEEVRSLFERCAVRDLSPGDCLLSLGQSNQTMYMILAGRLSVHLESTTSEPVAFIDAGQTVGELSVIDDSPASAYVLAAAPSRLLAVREDVFWALVSASHELAVNLLRLLAQRMRTNNSTLGRSEQLRRRFEHDALFDGLTGVHNRRWLNETLPRFVRRYGRGDRPLSVVVLDVDRFKRYNDDFGHAAGDAVLATIGALLAQSLRPTDLPARYGGEEFVLILPDTDLKAAVRVAQRLRGSVSDAEVTTPEGRHLPRVTISLGVAELQRGDDSAALLARADRALYRAKETGRDRVEADL